MRLVGYVTEVCAGGLWDLYDQMEVSHIKGFARDPEKCWRFELELHQTLKCCSPNAAHTVPSPLSHTLSHISHTYLVFSPSSLSLFRCFSVAVRCSPSLAVCLYCSLCYSLCLGLIPLDASACFHYSMSRSLPLHVMMCSTQVNISRSILMLILPLHASRSEAGGRG